MKRHPRPHQILALKANTSIHSVPTTNSPSPRINSMPHSLLVTHLVTYLIFANPSRSETQICNDRGLSLRSRFQDFVMIGASRCARGFRKNLAVAGRGAGRFLGGCAGSPQFCKTVPGLQGLRAFWIAADQAAQLLHSGIALAKLQQRITFL